MRALLPAFLASSLFHALPASAEEPAKRGAKKSVAEATTKAEKVVPKDPENVRGISPYEEVLARGKARAKEQDWSGAAAAFDEAVAMKPDEARGYLLLAQAKRDGDVIGIVEKGRTKKGSEATEARLLFVRAELLERKASLTPVLATGTDLGELLKTVWDTSKQAWTTYTAYVSTNPRAPDYRESAEARRKAIAEREDREQKYSVVRAKRDNK
jgi:tetratricopeptide (TPR) repeat protein